MMTDRKIAEKILDELEVRYPDAHCELDYGTEYQLLVSVILSAQCTDKRVNIITKDLFARAATPEEMVKLSPDELEKLIFSCGFYRAKAKSILSASMDIITRFGGKVPNNMDDLLSLRGVGRKTANVMLSVAFEAPAIPVDTHVYRVSRRLDLSDKATPEGVEKDLMALFVPAHYNRSHNLLIFHGRYCCKSASPECNVCPITELCAAYRGEVAMRQKA